MRWKKEMKYCSSCGSQLNNENQQFCSNCGAKLCADPAINEQNTVTSQTTYPQQQVMQNPIYQAQNINATPSMKWFKFLIYFLLFAGAAINLIFGFNYISGGIYEVQTDGKVTAEMVYSLFGGLKAVDVFYGIAMIIIGGFGIFTRFRLSKYRKNGPLFLYILYGAGAGLSLIYSIAVMSISSVNQISTAVASVGISVALIILNIKYFGKRKNLFTN